MTIRAQTKTKAPMQLPITVLTGIEFETALVGVGEEVDVATIVKGGAVREEPVGAPLSIAKAVVATAVLGATDTPEIPKPAGMDEGSILFARYRASLSNMMKMWQKKERLEGG